MPQSRASVFLPMALLALLAVPRAAVAELGSDTTRGWGAYVSETERRIQQEVGSPHGFLGIDFEPDAADVRRQAGQGSVVMRHVRGPDDGRTAVPGGLVHHWRGVIFVPGISVRELLGRLRKEAPPEQPEDVLVSRVLATGDNWMRVYLRLRRRKIVTAVFNTEHLVRFMEHGAARASSTSIATRIAEVSDPGGPDERERTPGHDRGFLWRLNAYWRFEEVRGGVIAECESISLSRPIPAVVRALAAPLVERAARESLDRTLTLFRSHYGRR
ncbi:MAG: hypothetical protein AB7P67_14115 [Vicinamibacterales bacterium]